jgi:hypothetical protein
VGYTDIMTETLKLTEWDRWRNRAVSDTEVHFIPKVDGQEHVPSSLCGCEYFTDSENGTGRTIFQHRMTAEYSSAMHIAEMQNWIKRGWGTD